jgi:hypothetical protein
MCADAHWRCIDGGHQNRGSDIIQLLTTYTRTFTNGTAIHATTADISKKGVVSSFSGAWTRRCDATFCANPGSGCLTRGMSVFFLTSPLRTWHFETLPLKMLLILLMCGWMHRAQNPPPPDAEYPVFERDFVNRTAYLAYLENS